MRTREGRTKSENNGKEEIMSDNYRRMDGEKNGKEERMSEKNWKKKNKDE